MDDNQQQVYSVINRILNNRSMAEDLAELANLEANGEVTNHGAKIIAAEMVKMWTWDKQFIEIVLGTIEDNVLNELKQRIEDS